MGRAQKLKQQRKEEEARRRQEKKKETWRRVIIVVASLLTAAATVGLVLLVNALKKEEAGPKVTAKLVLETSQGQIVIGLYGEETPLTVEHVSNLVNQGFYDDLRWYRVEDFVVQTGSHYQSLVAESEGAEPDQTMVQDAITRDQGVGTVLDEVKLSNLRGAVGMAKPNDPQTQQPQANSATTDFYILKRDSTGLDPYFTVFGRVLEGMEVVDSLQTTDVLVSARSQGT